MTVRLSNMEKGDPAQTSSLNLSYLNLIIKSQLTCLMLDTVHNCCITDTQKHRAIDTTHLMQVRVWNILVYENVTG